MGTKLTKTGISFSDSENKIVLDSNIKTIYVTSSSTDGKGSFNVNAIWDESNSQPFITTPTPTQLRSEDSYVWDTGQDQNVFWQIKYVNRLQKSIGIGGFGILGVAGSDGKATIKTVKIETSKDTFIWVELKTVVLPEDVHSNIHYITLDGKPGQFGYPWYEDGGHGYNHFRITFIDKYSDTDNIKVKGIDIYQTSLNVAPDSGDMVNPLSNPLIYKPDENIITTGNIHTKAVYHDYDKPLHDTVEDIKLDISTNKTTIDTHETEIGLDTSGNYTGVVYATNSVKQDISSLNDRLETLETLDTDTGKLIHLPQWSIKLSSTICPRIKYFQTGNDSDWYELNYDIFYNTLQLSSHPIPDRAILYVRIYTQSSATWVSTYVRMIGYDRVYYSTSSTLNPPLLNYEERLVETQGIQNNHSYIAWSGYLFPTWGNWSGYNVNTAPSYRGRIGLTRDHPRKLAVQWYGHSYITLLGYMMPDYTD